MLTPFDHFFEKKEEPMRSHLMGLSQIILDFDSNIEPSIKYGMPFFSYNKKMLCYLWMGKKSNEPYIGFTRGVEIKHPDLIQGSRKKMSVLNIDVSKDFPIIKIREILSLALQLYKNK